MISRRSFAYMLARICKRDSSQVDSRKDAKDESSSPKAQVLLLVKSGDMGGAQRLISHQIREMGSVDFVFTLAYYERRSGNFASMLENQGVDCHFIGNKPSWAWPFRLRRLLRSAKYDIVHVHSPVIAAVARILLVASLPPRPPLLTTEHTPWQHYHPVTRMVTRLTSRLSSYTIAVSEEVFQSLRTVQLTKAETLIHGVPLCEIRKLRKSSSEMRLNLGLKESELVIGTVAHLRPPKGHDMLLTALQQISDRGIDFKYLVVGSGVRRGSLERLAGDLGIADKTLFLGGRDDAVSVMSVFDVFLFGSTYEGWPVAVMEALALGLPIVATRVGGIRQNLDDSKAAMLVPPRSPTAMADALESVMSSTVLRHKMGVHAMKESANYGSELSATRIREIYRRLLK